MYKYIIYVTYNKYIGINKYTGNLAYLSINKYVIYTIDIYTNKCIRSLEYLCDIFCFSKSTWFPNKTLFLGTFAYSPKAPVIFFVSVCPHTHTHTHTHIYICIYICIHIYIYI